MLVTFGLPRIRYLLMYLWPALSYQKNLLSQPVESVINNDQQ